MLVSEYSIMGGAQRLAPFRPDADEIIRMEFGADLNFAWF